jgi:hypothetical protein
LAHFDGRREATIQDANIISTTALRTRMLPEPYQSRMLDLLRGYVALRVEASRNIRDTSHLSQYVERSDGMQESMWRQALALADADPKPVPTGLFIQSLNDLFDTQIERVNAVQNRIPDGVLLGLYLIASFVAAFTGYVNKSASWRARIPSYAVYSLIAAVMYLIQDLDRPWDGFVRHQNKRDSRGCSVTEALAHHG